MDDEVDLTGLTDEQIAQQREEIAAEVATLEEGEMTDETVTRLEELADTADSLGAEQVRRDGLAAERGDRAAAALTRLRGETAELDEVELDEDGNPIVPAEVETEEGAEPAEVVESQAATTAATATAAAAVGGAVTRPRAGSLATRRPAAAAPKAARGGDRFMTTTAHAPVPEGRDIASTAELAQQIVNKNRSFRNVGAGVRDYLSIGTGVKDIPDGEFITSDAQANFGIFRSARQQVARGPKALVASGGVCAPQTPLYDFYRLAEPQSPIEDGLATVGAPRGGINYIVPPDFRDAAGAIGTTTTAEDAAGYESNGGPTDDKPCITVECPDTESVYVTAISQCVTFGNLQYRTFPEQVESFLEDVAVMFALTKETYYYDRMASMSTAVTSSIPYGASRSLLFDWTTEATQYRKRHGMKRGATIQIIAPDWSVDLIKLDMTMDHSLGLSFFGITDAQIESYLRDRGLDVTWHNDMTATGGGIAAPQAAGWMNAWPSVVEVLMFAPGTFVRLDGGTLDVGLVRDSALNRTNDLELFMEEWVEVAMLGIEAVKLRSEACPNGTAPESVVPMLCSGWTGSGAESQD